MGEELELRPDSLTQEQVKKLAGDFHSEPLLPLTDRVSLGTQVILDTKD